MAEYSFSYGGFALDATNGVYIDACEVKPTRRVAQAEPEGRDGLYIGRAFRGATRVTLGGMLVGTSVTDFFAKQDALVAALDTEDPATLTWRDTKEWQAAQCDVLPAFPHTTGTLAACRVALSFVCPPDETAVEP